MSENDTTTDHHATAAPGPTRRATSPAAASSPLIPSQTGKPDVQSVRLGDEGTLLLIDTWSTRDPDVVASARTASGRGELREWLDTTLRLGVVARHAVGGSVLRDDGCAVIDGLDQAVRTLTASLQQEVRGSMDLLEAHVTQTVHPETGPLALSVQQGVDRLATGLGRMFGGETAEVPALIRATTDRVLADRLGGALEGIHLALGQHSASLRALSEQERSELVRSLVSVVERQDRELHDGLRELRQALHQRELADATAAADAQAEARVGSGKGATYEDALAVAISGISHAAGDGPSDATGNISAPGGSRAGDVTTTLTSLGEPHRMLVWEAKARPGRPLTASAWRTELSRARTSRAGQAPAVAIGVTPTAQLPGAGATGPILMLSPTSFVVGWEPGDDPSLLTGVYHLARLAAALQGGPTGTGVDVTAVERGLKDLMFRLQPLQTLSGEATKITRSAAKITDAAQRLLQDLEQAIAALQRHLVDTISTST